MAEDNLINQRLAKMMLASLGMAVEVVSNGQEAVEAAKRRIGREGVRQFDVLLMDMAMPVMGGVDATKVRIHLLSATCRSTSKVEPSCKHGGNAQLTLVSILVD